MRSFNNTLEPNMSVKEATVLKMLDHLIDEAIALGESDKNKDSFRDTLRENITNFKHAIVDLVEEDNTKAKEVVVNTFEVSVDSELTSDQIEECVRKIRDEIKNKYQLKQPPGSISTNVD